MMSRGTKIPGLLQSLMFGPANKVGVSVLYIAATLFSASCSGPSTNVQNPPPPPQTSVSISFQPSPPTTVSIGASTAITAVVSNDSTTAGVDWALLCPSQANCGKLSSLHTASGASVTYTPPSAISGNSQTFTIQGFATADHTKNVVTSLAVTGFASILKGSYVFATKGEDINSVFQLAGVITMDGNGKITSGEQTHVDRLGAISDPITGGSYFIGPDGRGTLTINTADQNIGQAGIENLSLVVLDNSRALIQTFDDPNLVPSNEASSGTLDLQTSTASPTGGYAFVVGGIDVGSAPLSVGGVLNIDSPNTISGNGSVADENDANSGLVASNSVSGTLTGPDGMGSLKLSLNAGFAPSVQFTGYVVDASHIELIETDVDGTGAGFGCTSGIAVGQGASTGTFTSNGAFAGSYVFKILGQDPSWNPSSLASLGEFTADASGNVSTGYNDEVLAGISALNGTTFALSDSFTGTYSLDLLHGTGRVDSTITYTSNGPGPELIFYLTGNGNPPLVLDADSNSLGTGISVGTGTAYPSAAPPSSFSGPFGVAFVQSSGSSIENDATGQATINSSTNTLAGFIDTTQTTSPNPDAKLTGTFLSPTSRFSGTLTNGFFTTPNTTISVAFYPVDANKLFFIETDFSASAESTLGYFTARVPLCTSPSCQ